MGQSMLDCPITITIGVRMTQLKLDLTTDSNTCKDCDSFTKQDEWANYEARICIDCNSVNEQDAWEDYQQRKADTMQP